MRNASNAADSKESDKLRLINSYNKNEMPRADYMAFMDKRVCTGLFYFYFPTAVEKHIIIIIILPIDQTR